MYRNGGLLRFFGTCIGVRLGASGAMPKALVHGRGTPDAWVA
ncbi:hypothetical protein ACFQ3W_24230 [Paenibacillus puldeungensis]|uniref:Uncharacterized protein n=1 Tax=Paenibacillus puldeungensis TaxID=696536 RepID=A0ABW3S5S0_9BACL